MGSLEIPFKGAMGVQSELQKLSSDQGGLSETREIPSPAHRGVWGGRHCSQRALQELFFGK